MNLDEAMTAHAEWKMKFRSAIQDNGQLDAASISADNTCALGQWLHGEAKERYAGLTSYGICVAKHAEFHRCAGKVAAKINAGHYTEAEAMLGSNTPFGAATTAVGVAIVIMRREARL
jgi:methyl-accepting chemotaxis protein